MTHKKISNTLLKIQACHKAGYSLEALLMSYHLNLEMLRFMLGHSNKSYSFENKKLKELLHDFNEELSTNAALKSLINKKSFKLVKTWLHKMDLFFKKLKLGSPSNTKALYFETEKIFMLLNISVNKLLAKNKA